MLTAPQMPDLTVPFDFAEGPVISPPPLGIPTEGIEGGRAHMEGSEWLTTFFGQRRATLPPPADGAGSVASTFVLMRLHRRPASLMRHTMLRTTLLREGVRADGAVASGTPLHSPLPSPLSSPSASPRGSPSSLRVSNATPASPRGSPSALRVSDATSCASKATSYPPSPLVSPTASPVVSPTHSPNLVATSPHELEQSRPSSLEQLPPSLRVHHPTPQSHCTVLNPRSVRKRCDLLPGAPNVVIDAPRDAESGWRQLLVDQGSHGVITMQRVRVSRDRSRDMAPLQAYVMAPNQGGTLRVGDVITAIRTPSSARNATAAAADRVVGPFGVRASSLSEAAQLLGFACTVGLAVAVAASAATWTTWGIDGGGMGAAEL